MLRHKHLRRLFTMISIRVAFPVSGAIVVQMGYYAVYTLDTVDKFTPKYDTA